MVKLGMEYTKLKDKILIKDCSDFNALHILECGQVFTYSKKANESYDVFSKDKYAQVNKMDDGYEIVTNDVDYFENYFDLKTDYSKIKNILVNKYKIADAVNFGYGIRILKQDILEVIIGFIISSNNNIERIKKTMAKIREFGANMGSYYAFPNLEQLQKITEQDYAKMGAGYRAKYLVEVAKQLTQVNLLDTYSWSTSKLKEWLLSLMGVGPKVADCILLFGYSRGDSFPVDTWIEKVYIDLFGKTVSRNVMSKNLIEYFGDLSGYAQQYLFYFKRSTEKNK